MKIFSTFLVTFFAINSVYGDFEDFFKAYPDIDAFLLAQQNNQSLLDPPKELYEQFHKELTAIRAKYPVVADIHHQPSEALGQVIVNGIDLYNLNASDFGPIHVEGIGEDMFLVTFTKPYLSTKPTSHDIGFLEMLSDEFAEPDVNTTVRSVETIGTTTHIYRFDDFEPLIYFFDEGSGDCFTGNDCTHWQKWRFEVNGTDVTLVSSNGTTTEKPFI